MEFIFGGGLSWCSKSWSGVTLWEWWNHWFLWGELELGTSGIGSLNHLVGVSEELLSGKSSLTSVGWELNPVLEPANLGGEEVPDINLGLPVGTIDLGGVGGVSSVGDTDPLGEGLGWDVLLDTSAILPLDWPHFSTESSGALVHSFLGGDRDGKISLCVEDGVLKVAEIPESSSSCGIFSSLLTDEGRNVDGWGLTFRGGNVGA